MRHFFSAINPTDSFAYDGLFQWLVGVRGELHAGQLQRFVVERKQIRNANDGAGQRVIDHRYEL